MGDYERLLEKPFFFILLSREVEFKNKMKQIKNGVEGSNPFHLQQSEESKVLTHGLCFRHGVEDKDPFTQGNGERRGLLFSKKEVRKGSRGSWAITRLIWQSEALMCCVKGNGAV